MAVEALATEPVLEPLAQPQRELHEAPGRVRIGVVGTGSLGRHHVRILASLPGAELRGIHDARPEGWEGAGVAAHQAGVAPRLGGPLLPAGRAVVLEKPIAASLEQADELLAAAA